ncbi:MAG: ABC-F family ATP-binding cassette domain-containing protein, partial [Candidatus Izemoplasmatales bacterium]|nr:ABC-F family ATP-binding cassette domain-containing protein [Candidatus Izemoplasmatales bacterium]
MNIIRVNELKKTFGGSLLFDHVSFQLNDRDKVALIGDNGVGKSTLLRMLIKEEAPDSGDLFIFGNARAGYLSQDVLEKNDNTLIEEMLSVFKGLIKIEADLAAVAKALEKDHSEQMLKQYSALEEDYSHQGGYQYHVQIDTMLSRFGFLKADYDRKVTSFSGGEKTRIAFAKLLLKKPEILLLDEPTNHMDIEIIEWLEDYLKRYEGTVLIVTHDKYFINKVAMKIFELDQSTLEIYPAPYEAFEAEKMSRYEQKLGNYERQQQLIAHYERFIERFRYKETKAKQAQDRVKKLERLERLDKPTSQRRKMHAQFEGKRPTEAIVIEAVKLAIGYEYAIQENIDFHLRGYDKLGVIGKNGVGKTTLLKTLLGELEPLKGSLSFLKRYQIGYFDQNVEALPKQGNLIQAIHDLYPGMTLKEVRSHLASFMFIQDDSLKDVSVLSGGEKVRLKLCLMLLEKPGLLILDEPTNHLDIYTRTIIEDVFQSFSGPIIFVSHDRYFINKVASKLLVMDDGESLYFEGNYDAYKEYREKQSEKTASKHKTEPSQKSSKPS